MLIVIQACNKCGGVMSGHSEKAEIVIRCEACGNWDRLKLQPKYKVPMKPLVVSAGIVGDI